jgi:glycosyltransferase involved in cell wall biosynthesis
VSEKSKAKLLSSSWAAIQPSSFEGWGITVIEANSFHSPVIASKTKGLTDSVVDGVTGILVPPKNPEVLAKVMEGLTTRKEFREKLSKNAYNWSKNFNWDKSAREFLRIITKTIDSDKNKIMIRSFALEES